MKFAEYLRNLNELVKENPNVLEMEVVSSADDEGNHFGPVHFGPSLGIFIPDEYDFVGIEDEENLEDLELSKEDVNAICIN